MKPEESEASSLVDVDSPHVQEVKSDFKEQAVKTETQARRMADEADAKARADAAKAEKKAEELKEKAEKKAEELNEKAAAKAKEAKKEIKKDARKLQENSDNPVFIANYILWGITATAVAYAAYKKNSEGKLDAQVVGTAALGLGALGAADYFVSK